MPLRLKQLLQTGLDALGIVPLTVHVLNVAEVEAASQPAAAAGSTDPAALSAALNRLIMTLRAGL